MIYKDMIKNRAKYKQSFVMLLFEERFCGLTVVFIKCA